MLIPEFIKRWAVMLLLAIAVGAFGFVQGIGYEQTKQQANKVASLVYVAKKTAKLQETADVVGEKVQTQQEKIRTVYKTIVKKEIEYVKTDPSANHVLEPSFVRLYNAASLACDPSESACQSDADVSGDVTKAGVIHQHSESAELYQECRATVEGWKEFYVKVRQQNNQDQPTTGGDE